ncbi:VTT domain-containing protein [Pyruvatibacter sp.]|uniref:DedA family protein n=1 Tax=Pyruvatibacter sp. TaxID=1981328 RepID=UPI0032EB7413
MDLSYEGLLALFQSVADSQYLVLIAIVLGTFILEDAATVAAALLASQGVIPHASALIALYCGIMIGDLGLYGLGALAARWPRARRFVSEHRIMRGKAFLEGSLFVTLFGARCVPGMRLPTYTASGFLGIPFPRFAMYAAVLAAGWATALYSIIAILGETVLDELGPWRWGVAALVIAAAIVLPRITQRIARRYASGGNTPDATGMVEDAIPVADRTKTSIVTPAKSGTHDPS